MKRFLVGAAVGMLALMTVAGPVSARTFGAVYANDAIYRVFGNAANVPDGTGTDPFAKFTNSTNADQFGVAEFAPGSPTGHHGGRWAVYQRDLDVGRRFDAGDQLVAARVPRRERSADPGPRRGSRLPLPGPRQPRTDRLRSPSAAARLEIGASRSAASYDHPRGYPRVGSVRRCRGPQCPTSRSPRASSSPTSADTRAISRASSSTMRRTSWPTSRMPSFERSGRRSDWPNSKATQPSPTSSPTSIDGSILQDTIEHCYLAFRRRLRDIGQASQCDCNACTYIPRLDLKFVVHHGLIARQRMAGREELVGRDVIVVHRLLKNDVQAESGIDAYALYTNDCVRIMGIADPAAAGLIEHRETYDIVGRGVRLGSRPRGRLAECRGEFRIGRRC